MKSVVLAFCLAVIYLESTNGLSINTGVMITDQGIMLNGQLFNPANARIIREGPGFKTYVPNGLPNYRVTIYDNGGISVESGSGTNIVSSFQFNNEQARQISDQINQQVNSQMEIMNANLHQAQQQFNQQMQNMFGKGFWN